MKEDLWLNTYRSIYDAIVKPLKPEE